MTPKAIIIHHSVTSSMISLESIRAIFKQRFGVSYLGYHYLIRGDGSVLKDLRDDQIGIHNNLGAYNNTNSLGVCMAGDFTKIQPTKEQLDKLRSLLDELCLKYNIPKDKLFGHRDFKSTTCPSDTIYNWLQEYKNNTTNMAKGAIYKNSEWATDDIGQFHKVTNEASHNFLVANGVEFKPVDSLKDGGWVFDVERLHRYDDEQKQWADKLAVKDKELIKLGQEKADAYALGAADGAKNAPPKTVEVIKEVKVPAAELTAVEHFRLALKALFNWTSK